MRKFPGFCELSKQITEPEEGVVGNLKFIAGCSEIQVTMWDLQLASEVGTVLQDWVINMWYRCNVKSR